MARTKVVVRRATAADLPGLLALRLAVDAEQEARFGGSRWSTSITEASTLRAFKTSLILMATRRGRIVGTLRMQAKKPWAIDLAYFTPGRRAVYLHDVDVEPAHQRAGIGRSLITAARAEAAAWPVDAIRADAYDGVAGAGPFYAKCGFAEVAAPPTAARRSCTTSCCSHDRRLRIRGMTPAMPSTCTSRSSPASPPACAPATASAARNTRPSRCRRMPPW